MSDGRAATRALVERLAGPQAATVTFDDTLSLSDGPLGWDSIRLAELVLMIEGEFAVELDAEALLEGGLTLGQLCDAVAEAAGG